VILNNMISSTKAHRESSAKEKEYLEGWQRARAELDNFRKRTAGEQTQRQERLKAQLIEPLLQLADNFAAMTAHVPESLQEDAWAQGVLHVGRQLDQILQEFGLETIGKVGEEFNPRLHEVIGEEKGSKPNQVTSVTRLGYKVGDTIVRPAQVKVSS
jgi:molecular chaperone GrpE